jgi:FAD/FMN-containing dehydrogenase
MTSARPTAPAQPDVVLPEHAIYDEARVAWNLYADQRPAAVVTATADAHVLDAIGYAQEHGLRVAPQGTGHFAAPMPDLSDALLLRTALHEKVEIDVAARVARVKAGAIWEDVVTAAAPHGLAAMHGSSPDVGVFGYVLGGGLSFYARRHGLACSHVVAIEVATADGVLRRVDAGHDPELFWALRGGGGNFGVVTAIEIALLPIPEVIGGATFWPLEHAEAVLETWLDWTPTAPESVTSSFRFLRLPPLPEVPEPLREVPVVTVDAVALDARDGAQLVARLRSVDAPTIIDAWGPMPAPAILRLHGDPEQPTPAIGDSSILGDLDAAGAAAFVEANGIDSDSPLLITELRQLGGALAHPVEGGGATSHLPGSFAMLGIGVPMAPGAEEAIDEQLVRMTGTMAPWTTGRTYLNFCESGGPAMTSYTPEDYERLVQVRAEYDPDRVFVGSHEVL